MSVPAASAYLAAVKWEDEDCYLKDFINKFSLPQVAKITKGQYLNLGVPSLANPSLNQTVLIARSGKRIKVAAQCVKFKDSNRVLAVGTKLSIPDSYEGWFEILSEDGRAVRCIESVSELVRRFPESCLVRENIKAHLAKTEDSEIISEKTRTIYAGETLVLVSEVHVTPVKSKSSGRYLRCFTTKGETVFLGVEQKGKFSPIAGEDNISGVHTIKKLLSKRFPLMVRLVHGKPPPSVKSNSNFVHEMRLYSLFEEESVMALPLLKDTNIVALPPSAPLKVQAPKNVETLLKLKNYDYLNEKYKSLMQEMSDKIQVFDISLSNEIRGEKGHILKPGVKNPPKIQLLQRNSSDPTSKIEETSKQETSPTGSLNECKSEATEESYDEIDQIYDYVRGFAPLPPKIVYNLQGDVNGNTELSPRNSSSPSSSPVATNSTASNKTPDKPEPPPIETIPLRRASKDDLPALPVQINNGVTNQVDDLLDDIDPVEEHIYEKVSVRKERKRSIPEARCIKLNEEKQFVSHHLNYGVKKLLMKHPVQNKIHQRPRYFKNSKIPPVLKEAQNPRQRARSKSLSTSPLFNIRYKSLINLGVDFDALDLKHSGGQESSGSGSSKERICERRNRLQRPKSLTDIFAEANREAQLCKYRNFEPFFNDLDNRKLIFCQEAVSGRLLNMHHKRIGTLYL